MTKCLALLLLRGLALPLWQYLCVLPGTQCSVHIVGVLPRPFPCTTPPALASWALPSSNLLWHGCWSGSFYCRVWEASTRCLAVKALEFALKYWFLLWLLKTPTWGRGRASNRLSRFNLDTRFDALSPPHEMRDFLAEDLLTIIRGVICWSTPRTKWPSWLRMRRLSCQLQAGPDGSQQDLAV